MCMEFLRNAWASLDRGQSIFRNFTMSEFWKKKRIPNSPGIMKVVDLEVGLDPRWVDRLWDNREAPLKQALMSKRERI